MIIRKNHVSIVALTLAAGLAQACDRQSNNSSGAPAHPAPAPAPVTQAPGQQLATAVDGAPADGAKVSTDTLTLTFKVVGLDALAGSMTLQGFECKVGASDAFKACGSDPFVISGLKHGEAYVITVRGVMKDTATGATIYAAESPLHFTVDLTVPDPAHPDAPGTVPGPVATDGSRTLSSHLLVGSAYEADVPEGLHVTEYSSTKTTGVLSFFRVDNGSDPHYATQYSCNRSWDKLIASIAPSGQALTYCHSTPTREAYKTENEYRLAHNHVEVATDTNLVTGENQERLSIAVYDSDFEWLNKRSRFWNACQNSEKDFITVPMLNNFFIGTNPEKVDFWYCDTYQADSDGSPVLWRVGAFVDHDHMDWNCEDCKYDRAVEAVYMTRANASVFLPEQFAQTAQRRILKVLKKLTP